MHSAEVKEACDCPTAVLLVMPGLRIQAGSAHRAARQAKGNWPSAHAPLSNHPQDGGSGFPRRLATGASPPPCLCCFCSTGRYSATRPRLRRRSPINHAVVSHSPLRSRLFLGSRIKRALIDEPSLLPRLRRLGGIAEQICLCCSFPVNLIAPCKSLTQPVRVSDSFLSTGRDGQSRGESLFKKYPYPGVT